MVFDTQIQSVDSHSTSILKQPPRPDKVINGARITCSGEFDPKHFTYRRVLGLAGWSHKPKTYRCEQTLVEQKLVRQWSSLFQAT